MVDFDQFPSKIFKIFQTFQFFHTVCKKHVQRKTGYPLSIANNTQQQQQQQKQNKKTKPL